MLEGREVVGGSASRGACNGTRPWGAIIPMGASEDMAGESEGLEIWSDPKIALGPNGLKPLFWVWVGGCASDMLWPCRNCGSAAAWLGDGDWKEG